MKKNKGFGLGLVGIGALIAGGAYLNKRSGSAKEPVKSDDVGKRSSAPGIYFTVCPLVGRNDITEGVVRGDVVRGVQDALKFLGFYKGEIDGLWGAQTRAAVIAFQESKGVKPDGLVGVSTYGHLHASLSNLGGNFICASYG